MKANQVLRSMRRHTLEGLGRAERTAAAARRRSSAGTSDPMFEPLEPRKLLSAFHVTSLDDSGEGSLRWAIETANASPGADVIEFDASLSGGTITLEGEQLVITEDLTINGPGADLLTIDADGQSRVIGIAGSVVSISGLTVTGGAVGWNTGGGGFTIAAGSDVQLDGVDVRGNVALEQGGGIWVRASNVHIANSTIAHNQGTVSGDGGGIYASHGSVISVTQSVIRNNEAQSGGGIALVSSSMELHESLIYGNHARRNGGGISGGSSVLTDSTVRGNSAEQSGGGIYGNTTVERTLIEENTAGNSGGGIRGSGQIIESTVRYNEAGSSGGGMYATNVNVSGSKIQGNSAAWGGGLAFRAGYQSSVVDTRIENNTASGHGGGVVAANAFTMESSELIGNTAVGHGGGMTVTSGDSELRDVVIEGNTAERGGGVALSRGGILPSGGGLTLHKSTVRDNTAQFGGGLYTSSGDGVLTLLFSTVQDNTADRGGGLMHNGAAADIRGSTIANNTADSQGGGIRGDSELTVRISTLSGNIATTGGAIFNSTSGDADVANSTIADNVATGGGGGIHNDGEFRLDSTIVAGNRLANGTPDEIAGSMDPESSHNLIVDAASAAGLHHTGEGNLVGVDPLLGPLEDNGGPTKTHTLPAGSPAIGAGSNPHGLFTDQRGHLRTQGGAPDIGAYERDVLQELVLNSRGDVQQGGTIAESELGTVYTFTAAANGPVHAQVHAPGNSELLARLAVYTSLNLRDNDPIVDGTDGVPGALVEMRFEAEAGTQYWVLIEAIDAQVGWNEFIATHGEYILRLDTPPAPVHFPDRPYEYIYPEGYASESNSEFLAIANPNDFPVTYTVVLRYEAGFSPGDRDVVVQENVTLPPGLRDGMIVTDQDMFADGVRADSPYAITVYATGPLAAAVSRYDFGASTGDTLIDRPAEDWTFARVRRAPGQSADFIVVYNPNEFASLVTLSARTPGGQTVTIERVIEGQRRGGFAINAEQSLPMGVFGVTLTSEPVDPANRDKFRGIVASLSHFNVQQQQGFAAAGETGRGALTGVVGSLSRADNEQTLLTVYNPSEETAQIVLTPYRITGQSRPELEITVQPGQTRTLSAEDLDLWGTWRHTLRYTSDVPVSVMAIQTKFGEINAMHAQTRAASTWYIGDAFIGKQTAGERYFETLTLYNPSSSSMSVTIDLLYANGESDTFSVTIWGERFTRIDLHELGTFLESEVSTNLFSMRLSASSAFSLQFIHYDLFFDGGWGTLGSPVGLMMPFDWMQN